MLVSGPGARVLECCYAQAIFACFGGTIEFGRFRLVEWRASVRGELLLSDGCWACRFTVEQASWRYMGGATDAGLHVKFHTV